MLQGVEECQMLLPEAEQQETLGVRHYPQASRRRISAQAVRDGFAALDRKDRDAAMREFNRAWRFLPQSPDSYWGAAIVCGMYSLEGKDPAEKAKMIAASLTLMKKAERYLPADPSIRADWQMDYAVSLHIAGEIAFDSDKAAAKKYFGEAEKLWLSLLPGRDLQNRRDQTVYYRSCWHLAHLYRSWGKPELQKKYFDKLPPEFRKIPRGNTAVR